MQTRLEGNPTENEINSRLLGDVLIVNANHQRALLLERYIRGSADSITVVQTGEEAIGFIDEGRQFTLVLASLELSGEKQGWSVIKAFAQEQPGSLRVLWTDRTPDIERIYSRQELMQMGVSEVVDPYFGFGATRDSLFLIMQQRVSSPKT